MRNTSPSFIFASFIIAALGASALLASGCDGGKGGGGGGGGESACFDYSGFDGTTPAASFKTDVLPIFQRSCGFTSCHGNSTPVDDKRIFLGPPMGTAATADDITAILGGIVDVQSVQSSLNLVAAGKPEDSFLMHKLDDTLECSQLDCAEMKACGTIMPQGAKEPLKDTERDAIRRWIKQGAQNN